MSILSFLVTIIVATILILILSIPHLPVFEFKRKIKPKKMRQSSDLEHDNTFSKTEDEVLPQKHYSKADSSYDDTRYKPPRFIKQKQTFNDSDRWWNETSSKR